MIIVDLLEEYRNKIIVENKVMEKNPFYNYIFGTGMELESTDKSLINTFQENIKQYAITKFLKKPKNAVITHRFQEIEKRNYYKALSEHYKKNLPLSDNVQKNFLNSLKRKFDSVGADIGVDTDDFYLYLAHAVYFSIFNDIAEETKESFIPNDEPIFDQMMRIFSDDNINYVVIATQVGMILVTNSSVRKAVTDYLKKGKTLEVIINSAEIRNAVGAHMRNFEISHQTDTKRICELWKELKEEVGKANLMVATTDLPMLHQVIKSSNRVNNKENNISVEVRMYAYMVRNKDDNISFTLTEKSDKYEIINNELDYLRRDAVSEFIITEEISE